MMKRLFLALQLFILFLNGFSQNPPATDDAGWADLFDGETFTGWRLIGGETDMYIKDGAIVNRAILGSPETTLATVQHFDNFILTYEVKSIGELNSGMNFRGHIWEKDTNVVSTNGQLQTATNLRKAGEVWAYQAEVDTKERAWSGGLYESKNRGWLVPLKDNESARKAYKKGDWNTFIIKADGNHIQTWINGVLAVDTRDDNSSSGFIGMQNHSVPAKNTGQAGMQTLWRNIRIKEL